jgi:hypothetical protein
MVEIEAPPEPPPARPAAGELLTRLERGEMKVDEVLKQLRGEE